MGKEIHKIGLISFPFAPKVSLIWLFALEECNIYYLVFSHSATAASSCLFGHVLYNLEFIALSSQVFARKIVYVIDTSGSMQGKPLEATKSALCAALSELNPGDSFNIIAFNGQTFLFSSTLKLATKETIDNAMEWMHVNLVAGNGTNFSLALNKVGFRLRIRFAYT